MQFSGGPHLNFTWGTPLLVLLAVAGSVLVKYGASLSMWRFVVLLLNAVGTALLASAFEPKIPRHGNGWWDSIKHAVIEFPKYGSPPGFDIARFYVGVFLLLGGILLSAAT